MKTTRARILLIAWCGFLSFVISMLFSLLLSRTVHAQQPPSTIATVPAYSQNYVTAYGAPQPIWRTPIRTGLWRAIQPRGFFTPTYAVPVAPQNVQHFCPECRQYHR